MLGEPKIRNEETQLKRKMNTRFRPVKFCRNIACQSKVRILVNRTRDKRLNILTTLEYMRESAGKRRGSLNKLE
jgi:hypothetical protein